MASGPITSWEIDGETVETVTDFIFLGSKITVDGDCSHEIKRCFLLGKSYDQPRQHIKKQRHYFTDKGASSQSYDFTSSHIWMWELDYKESWVPKNWCFWTVVLEKTLESTLDCKEIKPVKPKGSESESHLVLSDSLRPHELYHPWNSPGQNTGVGSLSLLQGIFPTQGSNPGLPHCRWILYQLSHKGSPFFLKFHF